MSDRFAITFLSRSNKNIALPEEVMLDKTTGQILNKNISGEIISFDKLSRLKNHVDNSGLIATNLNFPGYLYLLELDTELPSKITYGQNLLTNPLLIHENKVNAKSLLFFDLDCIELSDLTTLTGFNPTISVQFTVKHVTDVLQSYTYDTILPLSPTEVLDFNVMSNILDLTNFKVSISSISFIKNILELTDNIISILYNILVLNN